MSFRPDTDQEEGSGHLHRLAFLHQYNLILLGGAAAISLALLSPTLAAGAALVELGWVTFGARSGFFRRAVARQRAAEAQAKLDAAEAHLLRELDAGYAGRARKLGRIAADVRGLARQRGIAANLFAGPDDPLDALILAFVKMAELHQRLSRFVAAANPGRLEEEIVRMGQALAEEKDPAVRLSLRQALTLGQRRLKQHEQIENQRRALEVKMGTLEGSFDFLRARVFSGDPPDELAAEVQELVAGASFLGAAEAEASAALARLSGATPTRTVTSHALGE